MWGDLLSFPLHIQSHLSNFVSLDLQRDPDAGYNLYLLYYPFDFRYEYFVRECPRYYISWDCRLVRISWSQLVGIDLCGYLHGFLCLVSNFIQGTLPRQSSRIAGIRILPFPDSFDRQYPTLAQVHSLLHKQSSWQFSTIGGSWC